MKHADQHPADFLAAWYAARCDGDWEHQSGVRIDTLDNPGWALDVDLAGTQWSGRLLPRSAVERAEDDWMIVEVTNSVFRARGGARNLVDLMRAFQDFITTG